VLVTANLESAPDAFIRTFTVTVPTIQSARGAEAEFDTPWN
jgi:hypothetical protein